MSANVTVEILLSTYNGSDYIGTLLNSIFQQNYKNWRIIYRDDDSNDDTIEILKEYSNKFPDKVKRIKDNLGNIGVVQSYNSLIQHSSASYIMFCDQDDVWHKDKIEVTMKRMIELESEDNGTPILIHTDLTVVDANLNVISDSFWEYQHINPDIVKLKNLLVQNVVTGCTVIINAHLKKIIGNIPKEAIMHDWWMALVAANLGKISYLQHSTILYRQHSNNDTGAKKYTIYYFINRLFKIKESIMSNELILKQTNMYYNIFYSQLSHEDRVVIKNLIEIYRMSRLKRINFLLKNKIHKYGLLRNIGFYVMMFIAPKK